MTLEQTLSMAVLAGTLVLFIWNRLRYDIVAILSLLAALATGVVPMKEAFSGFSDQVVIVVASALVVSAALSRSGLIEQLIRPLAPMMAKPDAQVGILVSMVTVLSAFMKNIGALSIFIPLALNLARRHGTAGSLVLMPLAFGSLIGGLATLIGTSPNIIVSRIREEVAGTPYHMFDFAPVGVGIAVCGVLFLTFGWRLLPKERQTRGRPEDQFRIADYLTEVRVTQGSPLIDSTVNDLEQLYSGSAVTVAAVIRDHGHRYIPGEGWVFVEGDILILEGDPDSLKPLMQSARLELAEKVEASGSQEDLGIAEVVVGPTSPLVGTSLERSDLRARHGIAVLAVSRGGRHFVSRLRTMVPKIGDVLVIEGEESALPRIIADLGCLPLAQRNLRLGREKMLAPALILAVAMAAIGFELVPVSVGFFAAAAAMLLVGVISPRDAYDAIEWPIIVMLAALIPVSDAIQQTGASEVIAGWLRAAAQGMPPSGAVALMMVTAMILTPFLNNAATVLVMAPIAASLARQLGLSIDPFLMAVAIGAACDFLTPIGHQCNTLVMGPGGYRFGDYWRLGLPLTLIVVAVGVPLILLFWPV